jgi:hypothetical protein
MAGCWWEGSKVFPHLFGLLGVLGDNRSLIGVLYGDLEHAYGNDVADLPHKLAYLDRANEVYGSFDRDTTSTI